MREVDEALRADQFETFMRRYGKLVLAVVVVALLALAAFFYWQHRKTEAEQGNAEQLTLALDDLEAANLDAAAKKLAPLAAQDNTGYAALAQLAQAGLALEKGNANEAAVLYGKVANNGAVAKPLRDLATVREVAARYDTMPPQAVVDRLSSLAQPGNPWFGIAGEMVGGAYLRQGKVKQAGPLLVKIARDKSQPQGLRNRVRQLAGMIGYDAIDDVVGENGEGADAGPASGE